MPPLARPGPALAAAGHTRAFDSSFEFEFGLNLAAASSSDRELQLQRRRPIANPQLQQRRARATLVGRYASQRERELRCWASGGGTSRLVGCVCWPRSLRQSRWELEGADRRAASATPPRNRDERELEVRNLLTRLAP